MIHADQLSKEFGRFQAVKNASFQIEKGEIVGFLGPNGAGKTTTLRMLTGYLPPTSGTATIAGFDIVKNPLEARKHLGYLPEHVPLYDDQRVTEYLKFRARLKGISSRQIWPAVSKVVEQCGLDPVRRKMIRTLSKGYRQRVGLADALLGEPDLLILDDFCMQPLDTQSRGILMDIIEDRHQRRSTMVTSQIPVKDWYDVIGEKTIADAVLDRIVHHSLRVELFGESIRKRKAKSENAYV